MEIKKTNSTNSGIDNSWKDYLDGDVFEGERNNVATKVIGGFLRDLPIDEWATKGWLSFSAWNKQCCKPSLSESELRTIFDSIAKIEYKRRQIEGENRYFGQDKWTPAMTTNDLINKESPKRKWLVDQLFTEGTINQISGDSNNGKTWILLHKAIQIAKGKAVFGHFATTQKGVMMVNEEDPFYDIKERLQLLEKDLNNLPIRWHILEDIKLEDGIVEMLIAEMKKYNLEVVIFDSLSVIHDKEENSAKEMNQVFDQMKKFITEGFTVIFTHHLRKKKSQRGFVEDPQQRSRGSSVINTRPHGHINCEECFQNGHKYILIEQCKLKGDKKINPFLVKFDDSDGIKLIYEGTFLAPMHATDKAEQKIIDVLKAKQSWLSVEDLITEGCGVEKTLRNALKALVNKKCVKTRVWKLLENSSESVFHRDKKIETKLQHNANLYSLVEDAHGDDKDSQSEDIKL
jgi:KaiC/GvpD/RAD55 family RecA-like ATPase